jgi:integrase
MVWSTRRRLPPAVCGTTAVAYSQGDAVIKSTAPRQRSKLEKPAKPHKDFPLFPHATRRWAKKVRGKFVFFGPWADPDAALEKWLAWKDDLLAGRTPRVTSDGLTIAHLCNRFLTAKTGLRDAGEIAPRTFADYFATCERLVNAFGKTRLVTDLAADDFERLRAGWAKDWGPVSIGNEIQRVRCVLKYGYDAGLVDRPIRTGPTFKRPSKKVLRLARSARGQRTFEAGQLRKLIDEANQPLKSMLLLAINGGLGNSDIGNLPSAAVDFDGGWLNYPRPKTGVARRLPLWRESLDSLREWLKQRPAPKDESHDGLCFVTKYGLSWAKDTRDNPISKEFAKLLKAAGIEREACGFYAIRHTFQTIGDGARDPVATSHIMGHVDSTMAGQYRERIDDARLKAVTDHVRRWLFPPKRKTSKKAKAK